jgi:LmbE family N-acetylglucosaminyl deacetylase
MLRLLSELPKGRPLRLLVLGAHSDDGEIGCGGTVLSWLATLPKVDVTWVVLTAAGAREKEARQSANALLARAASKQIVIGSFRDGFLPAQYAAVKELFEDLKRGPSPDVVLSHRLEDRHQDHRITAELTWNTWRDHLVLEYEILKYEGDLTPPNAYVHVPAALARRKVSHLNRHFSTQRSKGWFVAENFLGLMRLRGLESRSPSGFAEAFHARKVVL